jgi:hypothetical protein
VIAGVIDDPGVLSGRQHRVDRAQIAGQLLYRRHTVGVLARTRDSQDITRCARQLRESDAARRATRRPARRASARSGSCVRVRSSRFTSIVVGSWELGVVIRRGAMGGSTPRTINARGSGSQSCFVASCSPIRATSRGSFARSDRRRDRVTTCRARARNLHAE